MMGITGAFSSLGINETENNPKRIKKILKNCSLPNLVLSERPNFIKNICDDEIENTEQPIDFSKKYCETKVMNVVKNYNSSFSIYAETDLDQPTDYSLRYAEDDSDSDLCAKLPKSTEFVQDTIKTYCTEDTPYETPFNFSTSTSMSDLRLTKDTETKENGKEITHRTKVKSEFSSGLMSPEKPVNYCEEGTPGYFSRVASCGSLNCLSVNEQKPELKEENLEDPKKELRRVGKFPNETKAVKFGEVVNYAQETPLMFSRSSSLASLDSIEQHSIHDDRSSVVSDLSRLTSGIISPSELPDSPSQTVPPSPKPRKTPIVFPPVLQKKTEETPQHPVQAAPKSSVFEDVVKKFKMESTPLEFSTATSLSSLLGDEIDSKPKKTENLSETSEDEDILAACINIGMQKNRYSQEKTDIIGDSVRTYCTEDTPAVLSHAGSNSNLVSADKKDAEDDKNGNEEAPPETDKQTDKESRNSSLSELSNDSSDSDSEDLLQKCILAGMSKKEPKCQSSDDDDNILASCINMGMKNNRYTRPLNDDTVKNYCTEDTPAALSNEGSCSNLSALSAQETDNGSVISDLNSAFSDEDDERLLEACIKSGMAAISGKLQEKKSSGDSDDSSSDDDEALLQQCIQAGMPKTSKPPEESNELTPAEKALLEQCILDGMKKCQIGPRPTKPSEEETTELTDAEENLLRQCILSGMTKNKLSQGRGSSISRESSDLTDAERLLLQQCIMAGMPRSKSKREVKRAAPRRARDAERNGGEHTCCIHCPKNNANRFRQNGHVKSKRRYREREVVQVREGRDVNIVYVASQILTLKKEVSSRSQHEKWV